MDKQVFTSYAPMQKRSSVEPPRWQGVLTAEQIAKVRDKQIPVAFDPVQIGWIATERNVAELPERLAEPPAPLSWQMGDTDPALSFRHWQQSDLAIYRALLNDQQLWQYMAEDWPGDISDNMARDLITISTAAPHHEVNAVVLSGTPVGQARLAFAEFGANPQEAEISYWLGRSHWGKGLGKRIVRAATQKAFADHPDLDRIVAFVHPDNHASARVLAFAGYAPQGTREDGWTIFHTTR